MISIDFIDTMGVFWIPIVIAVAVAVGAGAAVAVAVFGGQAKHATVAVLGPRKAGKTTLGRYLETGTISEEYIASRGTEKHRGEIHMEDLDLKVVFATPGGDREQYSAWFDAAKNAKVIVFMFDLSRIDSSAYKDEVLNGAKNIQNWMSTDDLREDSTLLVVGTHRDQQANGTSSNYIGEVSHHPCIREVTRRLRPKETCYVSLMQELGQHEVLFTIGMAAGNKL